ncbi:MAG: DUF6503 family protein [Acidobacteriota bacterium]
MSLRPAPADLALAVFLTLLALPSAPSGAEEAPSPPTADEVLERSIVHHDPEGRFLKRGHRLQYRETRPNGSVRDTRVEVDVPAGWFSIVRDDGTALEGAINGDRCTATVDGAPPAAESEWDCRRVELLRNYYTYLWGLPMKLRDPGAHIDPEVQVTSFQGRPVYGLRVTYDPGVGEDIWYVYFDRDTAAMVGYRFYHDEAKGDGEYIVLSGELAAAGMRLPSERAWYTHQGDRHLGTDTLTAITPQK